MLLGCSLLHCCGKFPVPNHHTYPGCQWKCSLWVTQQGSLLSGSGTGEIFPKISLLQSSVCLVCSCWTWWSRSCVKLNKFKSFNRASRYILNIHLTGVQKSLVSCSVSGTVSWGTQFLWDSSTACLNRLLQDNPLSNWRSKQGIKRSAWTLYCPGNWLTPLLNRGRSTIPALSGVGAPQEPPSFTASPCPERGAFLGTFLGTGMSCQSEVLGGQLERLLLCLRAVSVVSVMQRWVCSSLHSCRAGRSLPAPGCQLQLTFPV